MSNPSPWLTAGLLLVGLAGIAALLLTNWWADRRAERQLRVLVCPVLRTEVRVLLRRDVENALWTEVIRCTALGGTGVSATCAQTCVRRLNAGQLGSRAPAPQMT